MAITNLSSLISSMIQPIPFGFSVITGNVVAPSFYSWWKSNGTYDTTLNGVTLSGATDGGLAYPNPPSGNTYLARLQAAVGSRGFQTAIPASVMLCDRLWHNGGIDVTVTTDQNITSPTWPARDIAGSTNGDGVFLAVEVSADMGTTPPVITVGYTNQAGTSGRVGTGIRLSSPTTVAGQVFPISLQAGDTGVRSVQSINLGTSWVSGTINLVAYREIAEIGFTGHSAGSPSASMDAVTSGFPRIFDSSVLYFMAVHTASALTTLCGTLQLAQG